MSTGLLEEAGEVAALALTVARERSERGHEAYALHLLAQLAGEHHAPDVETAEDRYSKALALADECGMRPLAAHCHLGLARLYRHTGKPRQVQEHLATATTMYREMDMQFWLEQA